MACNCEGNTYQIGMGCCQPVVANPNSYYTKSEIDEKLSGITTDGISEDEASELIDEALLDYYTKDEVDAGFNTINSKLNKKVDKDHLNGIGNIEVKSGGGLNGVYIYDRAPIRGVYTNFSWESGYVNGLEIPFNDNGVAIGKFNDTNDSYISGDTVLGEPYFQIGDGENLENRHNLFTIYDNGYIKTTGTDGNDVVLQDWMKESETKLSQAKSFIDEMNALAVYNNRDDGIQIPFTLYAHLLPSQPTYLKVTGTFDESVTSGYSITSLTLTPQAHNGTATEEEFGWSYPYTGTSNVILSGFTVDGYIPSGGLKTINGQTLEGSGDIQIGTGGTIDLSNYYTKSETNGLLDDKLDASAYTPTDLSGYWTSGETQEAINAATSGIPSSQTIEGFRSDLNALSDDVHTNYYTKSQVDALIATLQSKIDALEAQLEECCSGGGGEDTGTTEGTRYTLYLNDGTTVTGSCIVNGKPYYQIDGDWVHSQETDRFHTDEDLSAVTSVKLGECAHGTNGSAFGGFTNMTSITVTDNFAVIGHSSFGSCSSLLDIPHSEGLETIGDYAFGHCNSLTDITLPSTVTSIGQWAFVNCTGLTSVTIEATTPPTLGDWAFYNEYGTEQLNITIYVPAESVEAYKAASGWSVYADRIQALP